jgi:tellurite resistance protein
MPSPLKFLLPGWNAVVMGLAAPAALMMRPAVPRRPMMVVSLAFLAFASLGIAALVPATMRGLRDGSLLAPEAVAGSVTAGATPAPAAAAGA